MATQEEMDKLQESFNRKVKSFNICHPNIFKAVAGLPFVKIINPPAVHFFEICDQHFGDDWVWSSTMWNDETTVFFKNEADAFLFRLLVDYKSVDSSC